MWNTEVEKSKGCDMRSTPSTVADLKMEGIMSQKMWAASRNWKSQGN